MRTLSNQALSRITLPPELRVSEVEDKQDLVEGDIGEGVRGGGGVGGDLPGGGVLPGGGERRTTSSQEHLLALRKESETSFLQLGTSGRISKSPSTRLSKYLTGAFLYPTKLVFPPLDHLENNKRTNFPVSRELRTAGVESNIDGLT